MAREVRTLAAIRALIVASVGAMLFRRLSAGTALITVVTLIALSSGAPRAAAAQGDCNRAAATPVVLVDLPGNPFQAIPTADGCWIFVSMLQPERGSRKGLAVIRRKGGRLDLVRIVEDIGNPAGMTLTHDGKVLIIAAGDRVKFLDVPRLISGGGNPVLGELAEGRPLGLIEATVTSNDSLLFVSYEHGASVKVIDLFQTRKTSFARPVVLGSVAAMVPVSVVLSPDEKLLYVSAMTSPLSFGWPRDCPGPGGGDSVPKGAVLVFDVGRAASGEAAPLIGKVQAGCSPVRLALSMGGDTVYTSVRWDNALLAFDSHRILTDPEHALLARVPVGQEPVGVLPVNDGRTIIVANSHRYAGDAKENQSLTIVDASRLGSGAAAIIGTIPAGVFPREIRLTGDGRTLLLTNFGSKTLEMIDLARVPGGPAQ